MSFSKNLPPLGCHPQKKFLDNIRKVQGEVNANFGEDLFSSLAAKPWTDRQTDRPLL